jgi:hypothetical protein
MSRALNGPRVSGLQYREWLRALDSQDPEAVAPGNSNSTRVLMKALFEVGKRNGAMRNRVGSEGSSLVIGGESVNGFDWNQDIVFDLTPGYKALPPERLIEEIETTTGIKADAPPIPGNDIEPGVERMRGVREARDE